MNDFANIAAFNHLHQLGLQVHFQTDESWADSNRC